MIKPAIQGVLNVLKACVKAKTVKRVVLTSSAAAVSINTLKGTGLVVGEANWTDVEFLSTQKPPTWVNHPLVCSVFFVMLKKLNKRALAIALSESAGLSSLQDTS